MLSFSLCAFCFLVSEDEAFLIFVDLCWSLIFDGQPHHSPHSDTGVVGGTSVIFSAAVYSSWLPSSYSSCMAFRVCCHWDFTHVTVEGHLPVIPLQLFLHRWCFLMKNGLIGVCWWLNLMISEVSSNLNDSVKPQTHFLHFQHCWSSTWFLSLVSLESRAGKKVHLCPLQNMTYSMRMSFMTSHPCVTLEFAEGPKSRSLPCYTAL